MEADIITDEYLMVDLFQDWLRRQYATQKEAAEDLEISPQYLSDILQGKRKVPDHLVHHTGYRKAFVKFHDNSRNQEKSDE